MKGKDLFSNQSQDYARFRPTYPAPLFSFISSLTTEHNAAWDCGTGSGQAALLLAPYYQKIWATDLSDKQLHAAKAHPQIVYQKGTAEASGLGDAMVNMVTVAQAFHWFDHTAFAKEVRRVTRPGGGLVVWCYGLTQISKEVDNVISYFYEDVLGSYWEKERRLVEQEYATVQMPFETIPTPKFEMQADWSFDHLVGYLRTWSALQTYIKKNSHDPLADLTPKLEAAWGSTQQKIITWPLAVRAWRV